MNLRSTLHLFRSISMNKWLTFYALNTTHEKPSQFLLLMKRIRWGIRLNQKSKIKDENVHIFLTASGRVVKPSGQPDRFFTVFLKASLRVL